MPISFNFFNQTLYLSPLVSISVTWHTNFDCPNTLQAVLLYTSHYATLYGLLPFALPLVQHFPVPSVLKPPQSIILLVPVSLDTLNSCPSLIVTNYVSKAYKQLVGPTRILYILNLIFTDRTDIDRRLWNNWNEESFEFTKTNFLLHTRWIRWWFTNYNTTHHTGHIQPISVCCRISAGEVIWHTTAQKQFSKCRIGEYLTIIQAIHSFTTSFTDCSEHNNFCNWNNVYRWTHTQFPSTLSSFHHLCYTVLTILFYDYVKF